MERKPDKFEFFKAKEDIAANLEEIRVSIGDENLPMFEESLYNECVTLQDEIAIVETWDEMEGLIGQAKALEQDVAAILSMHGQGSISYRWPKRSYPDTERR